MLHAQLHTTSSATYQSYSSAGEWAEHPAPYQFRSTSNHIQRTHAIAYSTAPMQVANGSITTAASKLQGGILADETNPSTGYIPHRPQRSLGAGGIAPPQPLNETWDLWLAMAVACLIYALYRKKKTIQPQD